MLMRVCLYVLLFLSLSTGLWSQSTDISRKIMEAKVLLKENKPEECLNILKKISKGIASLEPSQQTDLYELLGSCHSRLGQYDQAISALRSGINAAAENDTIRALLEYQIGLSYYRQSNYSAATEHILVTRDLYKQIFGPESTQYTACLNTLGFLYNIQANYSAAERTFQEARQINLRTTGGENMQYARIINNLADVYTCLNRMDQADELYQTSLRIKESLSGKNSRDYAKTLYNLTDFQATLGRYENALTLIREAISIHRSLDQTPQSEYLKFLDYQAILTEKTGKIEESERLFLETLKLREDMGATNQDDYALNLINLGQNYLKQNQADKTLFYANKAAPLIVSIYGENHPNYGNVHTLLGKALAVQGNLKQARESHLKAIRIIQKSLGKEHIQAFHAQFEYARFLQKSGSKNEAILLYKKIDQIPKDYLKRTSRFLSEKELNDKIEEYQFYSREMYSLLRDVPDNRELSGLAFNATLFFRGYVLNNMKHIRQGIMKARQVSDKRDELISLHRQLENQLNQPVEQRGNTAALESQISDLESQISRTLGSLQIGTEDIHWEDVQLALGQNEAVVEYLAFADPERKDSIFYGALVLDEYGEAPVYIDLCPQSTFEYLFPDKPILQSEYISQLYGFRNRGLTPEDEEQIPLVDLLWTPVQKKIGSSKRIYIIPDGFLHRIAIAALPTSFETVVSDSFELVLKTSSREVILRDNRILNYSDKSSLLIGGIQYDGEQTDQLASRSKDGHQSWQYLPWAEKESQQISQQLTQAGYRVELLSGNEANEYNVIHSLGEEEGWRIIHIATHGYFNVDNSPDNGIESSYYGKGMTNSGLVLAGVNQLFSDSAKPNEDGLLSAYEVSRMDLNKTELVVLSACETGLGNISDEEGVYGLQRAFKLAGADKIIMSLWQVPDRETKDFMVTFYTYWLNDHLTIREAFQKTQHRYREQFYNPYQWAGFILLE